MKEISAEEKDRILGWFYEADVKGNEIPLEDRNLDICSILTNDGYIENGEYRSVLTLKGQSFYLNGGYVKEREDKEKPIRIAEEANKKARNSNMLSFLAIVVSIASTVLTYQINKTSLQKKEKFETVLTDSSKDTTIIVTSKGDI